MRDLVDEYEATGGEPNLSGTVPWRISQYHQDDNVIITDAYGLDMAYAPTYVDDGRHVRGNDTAAHIVKCVNACSTIPLLDLRKLMMIAYGHLWHMRVDMRTRDGWHKHEARVMLRDALTTEEREWGINEVKRLMQQC